MNRVVDESHVEEESFLKFSDYKADGAPSSEVASDPVIAPLLWKHRIVNLEQWMDLNA